MALGILLIILITLFGVLMKKRMNRGTDKLPPGPGKLPIIGNLHQLGELPHRTLKTLSQKFGDLMYLQLGSVPAIVVSSPDMAREIFKNHDRTVSGRAPLYAIRKITYNLSSVSATPYGETWRDLRKIMILELVTAKQVQSFAHIRAQEVNALIDRLSRLPNPVDLSEQAFLMTNNVILRVAFGETNTGKDGNGRGFQEIVHDIQESAAEFNVADFFPWLWWINALNGTDRRLEKNFQEMDRFFNKVIKQHLDPGRPKQQHEDVVDVLLRIQKDPSQAIALSDGQLKGFLLDTFIAATDTSATTVEWAMAELMRHPAARAKATEEVRKVGQGKKRIDEDDLPKLTYLKQVIKETFRLHPPAPLLVPRETTEKCVINKYEIPEKTRVFFNLTAISTDPRYWENPLEFSPERFTDSQVDYRGQHYELLPFGSGRRGCPGINFAIPNVELVLANLLYCLDWDLPKGMSPKDVDLEEAVGITALKKNAILLIATPINN